jgi:hypothetical protein
LKNKKVKEYPIKKEGDELVICPNLMEVGEFYSIEDDGVILKFRKNRDGTIEEFEVIGSP